MSHAVRQPPEPGGVTTSSQNETFRSSEPPAAVGWRYAFDKGVNPADPVPAHAVIGAWPVGRDGELGDFVPNPGHRPPAAKPGGSEMDGAASDPVEAALLLAVTGRTSLLSALAALGDRPLLLPSGDDGRPKAYQDETGQTFVMVLTNPLHAPHHAPRLLPITLPRLLDVLPTGTEIRINPGSSVSARATSGELRDALKDLTEPGTQRDRVNGPQKGAAADEPVTAPGHPDPAPPVSRSQRLINGMPAQGSTAANQTAAPRTAQQDS